MQPKVVFLDKDGTLIEDVPYNVNPALIRLMPKAAAGLSLMQALGFQFIVISNQSGVARGYFPETALTGVVVRLTELLAESGIRLQAFYYCPHQADGSVPAYAISCDCRKPAPGLIWRAALDYEIDLARSWFIGDILNDVEAGRRAGCRTILLDNGHETEWRWSEWNQPDLMAKDLYEAAQLIAEWERSGECKNQ